MPGIDAKLVFETSAGQAWGSLHVNLVEHPHQDHQYPPQHQEHHRKKLLDLKQMTPIK